MVLRESNPLHLEVLGASPAEGVPLEVDVFDGASPATLLATLDGATAIAFDTQLNDVGGGGFRISRYDPKATEELLGREHLIKIKVGGIYRFSFWAEHRELVTVDADDEEGGEFWQISGRSAIAYLDRAAMANYSLIGDDPQPGGKWPLHEAGTGQSLGAMLNRCIQERLAEPGSAIQFLTQNWDYDLDSQGNIWSDTAEITVTTGDSLLDIWRQFTALGLDSRMRHDLRLEAYVELGRHYDVASGTGTVVFRAGKHFTDTIRRSHHTNEVKSRLWVKGDGDVWAEIVDPVLEGDPYVRRREGVLQFGVTSDPTTLQRAGESELQARALQVEGGISVEITNRGPGDYEPYVDYDVGDWVTIHEPGVYDLQTVRIVGMSIVQKEQSYVVRLDLNTIEFDELVQLARRQNRASTGSSAANSGLSAPSGTSEASAHPGLASHDAMGLATDLALAAAMDAHEDDTDPHPGIYAPPSTYGYAPLTVSGKVNPAYLPMQRLRHTAAAIAAGASADVVLTWGTAMPAATYACVVTIENSAAAAGTLLAQILSQTTTTVTVRVKNNDSASRTPIIHAIAME